MPSTRPTPTIVIELTWLDSTGRWLIAAYRDRFTGHPVAFGYAETTIPILGTESVELVRTIARTLEAMLPFST